MIPWVQLATTRAPGGAELKLMQRGSEFSIMVGNIELMNSRRGGSELALGQLACQHLRCAPAPHVLIGGLGMGFTLRATLDALGPHAEVTVAEVVPDVIAWARGALADVFGTSLNDPRVQIAEDDVAALIASARAAYDVIILDVDNGPDGLVLSQNAGLYEKGGLSAVVRALKPHGVLAVWSASQDEAFKRRLTNAGFTVQEHAARSGRSGRGARHVIWTAQAAPPFRY